MPAIDGTCFAALTIGEHIKVKAIFAQLFTEKVAARRMMGNQACQADGVLPRLFPGFCPNRPQTLPGGRIATLA